jgi:hypothetical protein
MVTHFRLREDSALGLELRPLHNPYLSKDDGLFFSSEAPGLVFSAPFSPSGRLYEPEPTSHFDKAIIFHTMTKSVKFFKGLRVTFTIG